MAVSLVRKRGYVLSVIVICLLLLAGCFKIKPVFTAKKDLSNPSKPSYEVKVEVYKVIDFDDIWKERKTSEEKK